MKRKVVVECLRQEIEDLRRNDPKNGSVHAIMNNGIVEGMMYALELLEDD